MTLLKDIPTIVKNRSSNQSVCKICFMNGKSCIYQRDILRKQLIQDKDKVFNDAFMLMPFKTIIDEVYRTQFEPCFKTFSSEVRRADDVLMTGFVICEKICKQIQESQFIAGELTFNNSNVFYELGLAYALNKNISIFIQNNLLNTRRSILKKLNADSDDKINGYEPFGLLEANTIKFWNTYENEKDNGKNAGITIILSDKTEFSETINNQEITYKMDSICKGSIHKAIKAFDNTDSLWDNVETNTIIIDNDGYSNNSKTFKDVEKHVRDSKCVIICTSPDEPCSYFWLGFAHGLEKDVIPITVYDEEIKSESSKQLLPFDVRALWHIYMSPNRPIALEKQVYNILQIISEKGKDTKNRRDFWKEILDSGSASIFVGSVELTEKNKRHVVGEWDYRTVSELISFFNSIQETMETFIQTPVFQTSSLFHSKNDKDKFINYEKDRLKNQLMERNSIIVGSADVNDMTEVALAKHSKSSAFNPDIINDPDFNGIVGFKDVDEVTFKTTSTYFKSFAKDESSGERGFSDIRGGHFGDKKGRTLFSSKYVPFDQKTEKGYSVLYGHLAKFSLKENENQPKKWIIVIQGISGPATLGLAQVLTGVRYKQFTIYNDIENKEIISLLRDKISKESSSIKEFYSNQNNDNKIPDIERHSELMTNQIVKIFKETEAIEAVIKIFVKDSTDSTHDERKIIWWDFELQTREMALRKKA